MSDPVFTAATGGLAATDTELGPQAFARARVRKSDWDDLKACVERVAHPWPLWQMGISAFGSLAAGLFFAGLSAMPEGSEDVGSLPALLFAFAGACVLLLGACVVGYMRESKHATDHIGQLRHRVEVIEQMWGVEQSVTR